jgi:hypothetical protein
VFWAVLGGVGGMSGIPGMSGVAAGAAGAAAGAGQAAAGAVAQVFLRQHKPPSQADAWGADEIANEPARTAEVMNLYMNWFPFECRPGFPAGWIIVLTASNVRRSGCT